MVYPSRRSHIVVLLSLGLSLMCATANAQLVFSTPNNISNNQDYSFTPQMAVDPLSHIYAVWEDDTNTNSNILFSRSTDGGLTFPAGVNLSNSTGFSTGPRIAVDAQGNVSVVWLDNTPGNDHVFFRHSGDSGLTFTPPVDLSKGPLSSSDPQVAVDGQGNIHVLWQNQGQGTFYTHSSNGGANFSTPVNLASTSTSTSANTAGSRLSVASNGNVYVVWQALAGGVFGVYFSASTNGGGSFSSPKKLSNPDTSFAPQLAFDGSGNINVIWVDSSAANTTMLFRRSTDQGATFSAPKAVSSSGAPFTPQMQADAAGNIYIVWYQSFPADIFFARSTDGGATFSAPVNVSSAGNSSNPLVAVDSSGNVDVSWLDTTTTPQVFFSQSADQGVTFTAPQNVSKDAGNASQLDMVTDSVGGLELAWSDDASSINALNINQIMFSRLGKPNQPPVANAGGDQSVVATSPNGASVTLDGSQSSDPNGFALTYQWTEGSTVVGNTATVALTASIGTHTYTLTVKDTANLSNSAVTHVTVSAQAPIAKVGPDQTVTATGPNGAQVALDGSQSSDPNGFALTYQWTDGSTVLGNTATVALTASIGTHTYMLTVTNTAGLSATAFAHVTVKPAAPVANAGADQTVLATGPNGAQVALNGLLSSDPNGYALTYQWTEGSTVVGNTATVVLTASIGTHAYTLTVTNTAGLSNSVVTHVTVKPQPPVANAGADQTVLATGPNGAQVALDGSLSSDPNGYALTYQWTEGSTVVGNTATVALTASIGTHAYTLTVTNTAGLSNSAVTHVTVKPQPPVANAGADQTVLATGPNGAQVALNGSLSSDPNGYALTYQWTEGSTVVGNTATVALTASIGTHTYTLTVTDTAGLSNSAVTHVTVNPRPPVANAGADQTLLTAGPSGAPVTLNGSLSSDPNGYALTYVWTEGTAVVGNSAVVSLTASIGTHTYTLTVKDTAGLSTSAMTHVTVNPRPPVVAVVGDPQVECGGPNGVNGTAVKLDGSGSYDPNGYPLKYTWMDDDLGKVVGNTAVVTVFVAVLGPHHYTLSVTDMTTGMSAVAPPTVVNLVDTTAPMLSFSLSTNGRLTNNKLVLVNAAMKVSDTCDPHPIVKLVSITSSDPADKGHSAVSDVQAVGGHGAPVAFGSDVTSFLLRAERPTNGARLFYYVTYSATDASKNSTTSTVRLDLSAH